MYELFPGLLRGFRGELNLYGMRGGKGGGDCGLDLVQCMRGREGAVRLRSECMRGLRRGHLGKHTRHLQLLGLRCRHLQSHGGGELLALRGRQIQLDERIIMHELFPGLSRNLVRCFDLHGMRGGEGGGDGGLDLVQCMRGRQVAVRLRSERMRGLRRGHLGKHTREPQLLGL